MSSASSSSNNHRHASPSTAQFLQYQQQQQHFQEQQQQARMLDRMNSSSFKSTLRVGRRYSNTSPSNASNNIGNNGPLATTISPSLSPTSYGSAYRRSSVRIRRTDYSNKGSQQGNAGNNGIPKDLFNRGQTLEDIDVDNEINECHMNIQRRNHHLQFMNGQQHNNFGRPHSDTRYQYHYQETTSPERHLSVFPQMNTTPLFHTHSSSALMTLNSSPTGGQSGGHRGGESAGSSLASGFLTPDDDLGSAELEIDIKPSPVCCEEGKLCLHHGQQFHHPRGQHNHHHHRRMGRRATTAVEGSCRSISASGDDGQALFLSVNSLLTKQGRSASSSNFLEVPFLTCRKGSSGSSGSNGSSSCCQTTHSSPTRGGSYDGRWAERRFAGVRRNGPSAFDASSDDDEGFTSDSVNGGRQKRSHSYQPPHSNHSQENGGDTLFPFVRRKMSDRTGGSDRSRGNGDHTGATSGGSSGGLSPASPLGSVNISIMLGQTQVSTDLNGHNHQTANTGTQTAGPSITFYRSVSSSANGQEGGQGSPRKVICSRSALSSPLFYAPSPASSADISSGQWTPVSNTLSTTNIHQPDQGKIDVSFPRSFATFIAPGGGVKRYPFILQRSLFPNVSPTIYFGSEAEDGKIVQLPREIQKQFFLWKLSSITPTLIRETVIRSGFRLLKEKTKTKKWLGTWCKHIKSVDFGALNIEYNKVNHFPGSFHLGRKDKLWFNLQDKSSRFGEAVFSDFHPMTYVLPQDLKALRRSWISATNTSGANGEDWKMILKPPASARGNGITVINKWSQIPKGAKVKKRHSCKAVLIAQEYISNPCLLFNESKFDLRVYVLVSSFHPLRVYIYEDGLVRFASEKYSSTQESLSDPFVHLTNYSINKTNHSYKSNNEPGSQSGHKWSLNTLWKYLNEMDLPTEVNVDQLRARINDMIIKTVISCEDQVNKLIKKHTKSRYTCFELLGFDIMIDSNFKPWLLEVNISPSLRSESSLDSTIKGNLIKDMLNLVGYRLPPSIIKSIASKVKKSQDNYTVDPDCFPASSSATTPLPPANGNGSDLKKIPNTTTAISSSSSVFSDDKFFSPKLSREEKAKHLKFEQEASECDYETILDNLTPDDVRILIETEDEFSRRGAFHRIFPGSGTDRYMKYFDENRYYNILLYVWGNKYDEDPARGIELLQSLAREKLHLKNRSDGSVFDRLFTKWKGLMRRAVLRQLFKSSTQASDGTEMGDSDEGGTTHIFIPG